MSVWSLEASEDFPKLKRGFVPFKELFKKGSLVEVGRKERVDEALLEGALASLMTLPSISLLMLSRYIRRCSYFHIAFIYLLEE